MIVLYSVLVLCLVFLTFYKSVRSLHMLQQNLYNENNRYLKWVVKNYKNLISFEILAEVI